MKRFLVLLAVSCLVTAGTFSYLRAQQHHNTQQPVQAIGVKIVEENGWSGSTDSLPAVDGYSTTVSSSSGGVFGGSGGYDVNACYHVTSSSPGHFFVLAHYTITRNGTSTEVDKALPVLPYYTPSPLAEEKLKRPTWTNLDDHLSAFAYLSDSTLYY